MEHHWAGTRSRGPKENECKGIEALCSLLLTMSLIT